ncbi:MAG: hypothetical protein U5K36_14170 [Roseovarius sp.]|nr:hypothetical protein [Roseovarius sp.]
MHDSETIRAQISETEARYPIPDWDHTRRKERPWVLRLVPPGGIGLEVGVFRGCFPIAPIASPSRWTGPVSTAATAMTRPAANDFVAEGGWNIVKAGPGLQWAIRRSA